MLMDNRQKLLQVEIISLSNQLSNLLVRDSYVRKTVQSSDQDFCNDVNRVAKLICHCNPRLWKTIYKSEWLGVL